MGVIFQRMFTPCGGLPTPALEVGLLGVYLIVAMCHWLAYQRWFKRLTLRLPSQLVGAGYCTILALALLLAPKSGQAFIYFQF